MKLGYVTDYLGKVIFEARAPVSGVVLVCLFSAVDDEERDDCEHMASWLDRSSNLQISVTINSTESPPHSSLPAFHP